MKVLIFYNPFFPLFKQYRLENWEDCWLHCVKEQTKFQEKLDSIKNSIYKSLDCRSLSLNAIRNDRCKGLINLKHKNVLLNTFPHSKVSGWILKSFFRQLETRYFSIFNFPVFSSSWVSHRSSVFPIL